MSGPLQALVFRLAALVLVAALVLAVWGVLLGWGAYRRRRALRTSPVPELSQGQPTILLFTGTLCSECHTQKEIIDSLLGETADGWRLREIHAAREVNVARRFGVESVPATVVIDAGGRPRAVNYGLVEAGALSRQLQAS
jgi:hypothetical protein